MHSRGLLDTGVLYDERVVGEQHVRLKGENLQRFVFMEIIGIRFLLLISLAENLIENGSVGIEEVIPLRLLSVRLSSSL